MLAETPSWLGLIGLVCSIAVSVGVILTAVRKWFQRIVEDAVRDELDAHAADDAKQFADLRAIIERRKP